MNAKQMVSEVMVDGLTVTHTFTIGEDKMYTVYTMGNAIDGVQWGRKKPNGKLDRTQLSKWAEANGVDRTFLVAQRRTDTIKAMTECGVKLVKGRSIAKIVLERVEVKEDTTGYEL